MAAPVSGVTNTAKRDGERLHKVLLAGPRLRRNMEALIEAGTVGVNGVKAHVGQVVNKDRVHVKRQGGGEAR